MSYSHDSLHRLETATDPLGRVVRFFYDDADRVIRQRLPDNREITFDYDAAGNLISLTPAGRSPHIFAMTPVNLEERYTPPSVANGGHSEYVYDLDRELTSILHPGGSSIGLSYDSSARLEGLTIGRGSYSFGYDNAGNLSSLTSPDGTSLAYSYDGTLPLSVEIAGPTGTSTLSWQYDSDLAPETESLCDALGVCNHVTFEYDNDKVLTRAGDATLIRDADNGRLTGLDVGAMVEQWTYNDVAETASHESRFGGTPVFREDYIRDTAGRITSKQIFIDGVTTIDEYFYDLSGRLITVRRDGVVASGYQYDSNGHRLSRTTANGTESSSCDGQDRMIAYGNVTFGYTPAGDLETRTDSTGTTSFVYDELGSLIEVTLASGPVIQYEIDAQNRRTGRKVNDTVTNRWLYSDQLRIAAELDAAGSVVSRFVYGSRSNTPDLMIRSGVTYRIISDHLGSPRLVVDTSTGAVAQRLDYDEFGVVLADSNPGFQPFGFAGGLYDTATGLVRFGARDYDARTGRWTTKDPALFTGGGNVYTYAFADPVNFIDRDGQVPLPLVTGLIGGLAVASHDVVQR